jgi:hypothetical protein
VSKRNRQHVTSITVELLLFDDEVQVIRNYVATMQQVEARMGTPCGARFTVEDAINCIVTEGIDTVQRRERRELAARKQPTALPPWLNDDADDDGAAAVAIVA